jgi:putative peptide zinc metalloprotease protein
LISVEWESFTRKLPTFQQFFAGSNWFWLAAVLGITKILHELGHGLACKRFGGHCHEMGVMFLVLTPCLYCNVSDAWMLPSKWRRMMIAAAGMYVELALAAIATWVWWISEPGLIHQLSLNVMFVCSVTTLIFNVNPLMRYDGYYILSDWLEIPNLRQKATTLSLQAVNSWFLAMAPRPDPFLPTRHQWLFVSYTVAAIAYRWVITFSIFWFLYQVLEPYGLQIIGQVLALMALYGLLGVPVHQLVKYFSVPGRWQAVKTQRLTIAGAAALGLLSIVFLVPFPYYISCSCYVEPHQAEQVYVELPGTLVEVLAEPNTYVKQGQPIVRLASAQLDRELIQMAGETSLAFAHHQAIERHAASSDPQSQQELAVARTRYNRALQRWSQREQTAERLTITAPRDGLLLPPPHKPKPTAQTDELPTWSGSPLDRRNLGATLTSQTLIGTVCGDVHTMNCILAIDQSQIEFLEVGQIAEVWIRQWPQQSFRVAIDRVSRVKLETIPAALANENGGDIVAERAPDQQHRPTSPTYAASAVLSDAAAPLVSGATGVAQIRVGSRTLGQRIWRAFLQTFRFEL